MHETVDGMLEEFEKVWPILFPPSPCHRSSPSPHPHQPPLASQASPGPYPPRLHPHQAGISFQGCLYSFVFCLLVFAWSAYEAAQTPLCVLTLTSMALATAYFMIARTKEVEIQGD